MKTSKFFRNLLGALFFIALIFLGITALPGTANAKPAIHPGNNSAAAIGAYCGEVQSYIPTIVNMFRERYKAILLNGIALHNQSGSIKLDPLEAKRMLWLADRVYDSPDKDAEELQQIVDFECKAALMDGTWYK